MIGLTRDGVFSNYFEGFFGIVAAKSVGCCERLVNFTVVLCSSFHKIFLEAYETVSDFGFG